MVYLDLFERPSKFRGGAAFVVQCPLLATWSSNHRSICRSACSIRSLLFSLSSFVAVRSSEAGRQLPVMTVVAGFSRPASGQPVLLTHSKAETLFHEIGHVTHHMSSRHHTSILSTSLFTDVRELISAFASNCVYSFCRNRYQHLSGARGELDFVELPSILFENFIWDYRVLRHFAFHHRTGAVIPQTMVDNLSSSRRLFFAVDTCSQAQLVHNKGHP